MKAFVWVVLPAALSFGQVSDPLTKAYDALKAKDYDRAIPAFLKSVADNPARADLLAPRASNNLRDRVKPQIRARRCVVLHRRGDDERGAVAGLKRESEFARGADES